MDGSHELQEDTPLLVRPPYELRAGVGELSSSGSDNEEDEEEGGRWNGSHREERQSASQISSAARGALGFWLWLHGGAVYASLAYEDSWLARQRQAGQVGWVLVYGALLLGTVVLFAQVHSSDPGYLCKSSAAGTGSYSGASERGAIGSGVAVRPSMTNASDALSDNVGGSSRSRGHLVASSSSSDEDAGLGVGAETVELLPRTGARKDAGCELCGHITQPLRAKHCHDCGRCVSRYDHHCFWINTCVGERNHAAFLKFLALQSVFGGWSLVVLFGAFPKQGDTSASAYFSAHLLLSSVFLVTLLGLWFPLGLTVYHCYLALTAQTTWEHLRAANIYYLGEAGYPPDYHPWDVGLWSNFHNFCCTMVREDGQPTVWRLGVRPKHAVPRQNIFDNEYYSCC